MALGVRGKFYPLPNTHIIIYSLFKFFLDLVHGG